MSQSASILYWEGRHYLRISLDTVLERSFNSASKENTDVSQI